MDSHNLTTSSITHTRTPLPLPLLNQSPTKFNFLNQIVPSANQLPLNQLVTDKNLH
jgi:hypothetical protein